MCVCENCGDGHNGTYGSGRFCSSVCARGFSTKAKRHEINEKVSKKLKGVPLSEDHPHRKKKKKKICTDITRSGKYTDDDIIKYSSEVYTIAGLLKKLGLTVAGGNYANIKKNLQKLGVDTSHWTGQSWGKNQRLKDWSEYRRASNIKPHLIGERGHTCELCSNTEWLGYPINLEIHHIDGDRTNNEPDNLQLLCGNCHSTTDTFRGKNIGRKTDLDNQGKELV